MYQGNNFAYDLTEQYKQCLRNWEQRILILLCAIYCLNSIESMDLFIVVYRKT